MLIFYSFLAFTVWWAYKADKAFMDEWSEKE
jgi:hypothetical protein